MEYRYLLNGASLSVDGARCAGCGICAEVCPHGVFSREQGGTAVIRDRMLCMECGACALNCPRKAIRVNRGVGCAAAIIGGIIRGTSPGCGCDSTRNGDRTLKGKSCC